MREKNVNAKKGFLLEQDWNGIRPSFPVSSGGLHPGLIPDELEIYGKDVVLLVSGGIHGHPHGTRKGAMAAMQAIDAVREKTSIEEYAKTHMELKEALMKWGRLRPR